MSKLLTPVTVAIWTAEITVVLGLIRLSFRLYKGAHFMSALGYLQAVAVIFALYFIFALTFSLTIATHEAVKERWGSVNEGCSSNLDIQKHRWDGSGEASQG